MFLARKFTRAKWDHKADLSDGEISADAVTSDLRTTDNTLSFWECGGAAKSEIKDAVLALAAAGNRFDKIDVVWLTEEELQEDGQTLKSTPGRTPVSDLAGRHVDVDRLDYVRLGKIAKRIASAIVNENWCRFTEGCAKKLVLAAVKEGRIDTSDLKGKIRDYVQKSLNSSRLESQSDS